MVQEYKDRMKSKQDKKEEKDNKVLEPLTSYVCGFPSGEGIVKIVNYSVDEDDEILFEVQLQSRKVVEVNRRFVLLNEPQLLI